MIAAFLFALGAISLLILAAAAASVYGAWRAYSGPLYTPKKRNTT